MTQTTKRLLGIGLATGLALLLAMPAVAADGAVGVEIGSASVNFHPATAGRFTLTVTGPGDFVHSADFAGESPSFGVFDTDGQALADGTYKWSLVRNIAAPKASRRDELRGLGGENKARAGGRQSGVFTVLGGVFANPNEEEIIERPMAKASQGGGIPNKDQVILDDLIVDGSICAGFDCVNGESFGFDTIRIKENNLRIRAQDTSNSASFPTNDWMLTFNDSSNGGANKFSVDDVDGGRTPFTIEAGAPSHSLYVDNAGRLGLGTNNPVTDIEVKSGNTPTLRLCQDGSSGFTPQTWDVAGNEAGFFIRDATNGSTLPFRIIPGAPSSSIHVVANGDVGIGTSSPDSDFHVKRSDIVADLHVESTSGNGSSWRFRANGSNEQLAVVDENGGTTPILIQNGADTNLLQLGVNGSNQVDITGNLVVSGMITPDFVFEPTYGLESIEEHADFMWTHKHLPAVAPAHTNAQGQGLINVGARAQGTLEELEKAHIYIEQLHKTIQDLSERMEALEKTTQEPTTTF
jgi:hypothetical protein